MRTDAEKVLRLREQLDQVRRLIVHIDDPTTIAALQEFVDDIETNLQLIEHDTMHHATTIN